MKKILAFIFTVVFSLQLIAANWNSPVVISSGSANASNPCTGVDNSGNAVAIWIEGGIVYASNRAFSGGTWTSPTPISGTGASAPQLVVAGSGNATAIWIQNNLVLSATQPFGGSWGSATTLSLSGASTPQIAIDPNGDLVAIWARNGGIESATHIFGGSWPIPGAVDVLATTNSDLPQIDIGTDNLTVVAVWHNTNAGSIISKNKLLSGSWGSPTTLGIGSYPQVGVSSTGNAAAVWFQFTLSGSSYSNVALMSNALPSGGSWSSLNGISLVNSTPENGFTNPASLASRVAFDGNENIVAVWSNSFDGATFTIESSVSQDLGATWIDPPLEQVSSNLYAFSLDLAVDSFGDAFTAFMIWDVASSTIMLQASESHVVIPNYNLGFPFTLSSANNNGFPRIACALNGSTLNAAAVWLDFNGSFVNVQSAFSSDQVVQPPTGLAVAQSSNNLGVFTEFVNTVTWTASSSPNVTEYFIYRNGAFVTAVPFSATSYVDDNQQQSVSVTYGVATANSDGALSVQATVILP